MNQSIILIGYMGAGKTTLGKALSQNLGTDFCDLDWYIEEQCGKTIPDIFRESGEEGFRQIEREMLHEVIGKKNAVIAVGGGTPCFFDNMDYMNDKAMTVYLKAEIPTLIDHLHMSHTKRHCLKVRPIHSWLNTSQTLSASVNHSTQRQRRPWRYRQYICRNR